MPKAINFPNLSVLHTVEQPQKLTEPDFLTTLVKITFSFVPSL